ncbi:MAG: hypothetical protein EPO02_05180 [Nitrospirae bacterium]|nr:MAG: hypothetical protein EPO02_05180 [Nitrospirota bacterium]
MIALWALLAFLPPLGLAFLLVGLWGPGPRPWRSHLLLKLCLAAGMALGLSSCTYFIWLVLHGPSRTGLLISELTAFTLAAGVLVYAGGQRGRRADARPSSGPERNSRVMLAALSVCAFVALAVALTRFLFLSLAAPHGEVDALTIWNLRARFLARSGEQWLDSFTSLLATHVPDYPLLLPASIARWWTYLGDDPTLVPALVAMLFTFATAGLAASSLGLLRSKGQGLLAGIVLLGTPFLIRHGASQYGDVPLGFFMLATLVAFSLQEKAAGHRDGLLALAGMLAGFAAWTKNEGLLFVLVVAFARLLVVVPASGWKPYGSEMRAFVKGLLPVLLIVLFFKAHIAPGMSPIFAEQGTATTLERLTDSSRYIETGQAVLKKAARFGHPGFIALLGYLLLVGRRAGGAGHSGIRHAAVTWGLMFAGYFMIFIITPHGLRYQIDTSLDRLWIQLWPSAVFTFFLFVKTPEEAMAARSLPSGQG